MQQQGPPPPPPVGIAYDTAMSRMGDALAAVAIYGLWAKNDAQPVGLSVSVNDLSIAAFADSITRYYAGRGSPIGMALDVKLPKAAVPWKMPKTTIQELNDTADPVAVIKNGLTTLIDGRGAVVVSGPATTVAHLVALHGGREIVTEKSHVLVLAAGSFGEGARSESNKPDPNIAVDIAAARKVLSSWPVPIVVCGTELGDAVKFTGHFSSEGGDVEAALGVTTQALAAVLYAGRPKENYFKLSAPGVISIADDGRTTFAAAADGKHRYMIFDPAQAERVSMAYMELVAVKPRPPFRGRRPEV